MLVPREHGAYGQLLFPLATALLIGRPDAGAWLLAGAAVAAFLAHESLLVVLGQRGIRASREQGSDARRSLALVGGFCAVSGIAALALMSRSARAAIVLPGVLALFSLAAVLLHRERTTAGEIVVGATLASVSVPVTIAGAGSLQEALTVFGVFVSGFVAATVSVRALIGRVSKAGGPSPAVAAAVSVALVAAMALLAWSGRLTAVAPGAAAPVCGVALVLAVLPIAPRRLRAVGWTLVGATAVTATLLVAALGRL